MLTFQVLASVVVRSAMLPISETINSKLNFL